jgi:murein DD-endopeptidase MepM/ murein hydrolase activator NlpD
MRRLKLYYYSKDSLGLREVAYGPVRFVAYGILGGFLLFWAFVLVNQSYGDALGIGIAKTDVLLSENRILKSQLHLVSSQIASFEKKLAMLNDRGNELRLLVDLPKIDEEVRIAGTGGTEERIDFSSSPDVNGLLNGLRSSLSRTESEMRLQQQSYASVGVTYDQNKARFAHLPAIRPMNGYYQHKGIGMRMHPILGFYRVHEGLDITNQEGTAVYATADGTVQYAGKNQSGYGLLVEVNHGYSFTTKYAHLSRVLVREGQSVRRGDLLARSGNTGLSTAPHLHYEVRKNGVAQNPLDFFFDDVDYQIYKNALQE